MKLTLTNILCHRCPYLPEEDNEEDAPRDDSSSRLLVVTKNNQADLFNVDMVSFLLTLPNVSH